MKELFFAELRRFRKAALVFATVHLILQLLVGRTQNILEMNSIAHNFGIGLFLACGMALGLYQFGVYRQPARWIWLLHRPLPPARIFGAVGGASVLLIVLAVGLPALVALVCTERYTARVVDLRHYLLAAHLVLMSVTGWLAGTAIILSRARMAFTVLALPLVMLSYLANGVTLLLPAFACVAILAVVAYASFKPDRHAPPASVGLTVAMAVPLQVGMYCALGLGGMILYMAVLTATGTNPQTRPVINPGGVYALVHKASARVLADSIAQSSDPRAAQWRAELTRRPASFIMPLGRQFPVRGQPSNLDKVSWTDRVHSITWTFSHDAMRFHGQDAQTGEDRGWFGLHGAGDAQGFPAVPVMPGNDMIVTPRQLYVIDEITRVPRALLALTGDEVLVGPLRRVSGRFDFSLTNQRLIAHPSVQNDGSPASTAWSLALPGPLSDLDRVDIANLKEGTLLSFDFGKAMAHGASGSEQIVMFVGDDGKAELIARRPLVHDFPALYEHIDWWTSPLLHAVVSLKQILLDRGVVPDQGDPWRTADLRYPRPPVAIAAALLLAALSGLGAHRWSRASALPARGKAAWVVACVLVGVPALFSLMALQPRPPRQYRAAVLKPALA